MKDYIVTLDADEYRCVWVCMLYQDGVLKDQHFFRIDDKMLAIDYGERWCEK